MTALSRLAFIGNSLPRRCGIATFTSDLQQAVASSPPALETGIVAMTSRGQPCQYPASVCLEINDYNLQEYEDAAHALNNSEYQVVSLQHEFGIFGGEAGSHIIALLSRLRVPIVTTLHTVLSQPTPIQRSVLEAILNLSARVVVMAAKGRDLLRTTYRLGDEKIEFIPHGTPDVAFVEPDEAKAALGFLGRSVILTFGLLSPSKGIEIMIDAMPAILSQRPDAVYVVLGATHPNLLRDQGEAYRESLMARAAALGISDRVVFLDQFVDQPRLLRFISMCDVYVSPYLNEAQMTSGTLAYSFGLGKAVVSTPYWHARELLADGRGVLVPFGDATALSIQISELLTNDGRRLAMRERAYESSRAMTWPRIAQRYRATFESVHQTHSARSTLRSLRSVPKERRPAPPMTTRHLLSLCDDVGLLQHAVHCVPDRSHGYCTDDNARALLVGCALCRPGEQRLPDALTNRFAAFVQQAWNPDTKRFRNFLGYDRRWLEDQGSEDSHGRALWALGECARNDYNPARRRWAASLFAEALPTVQAFSAPRAWSFTLLGLDGYCTAVSDDSAAKRIRDLLADKLIAILNAVETRDWIWFEQELAYDNARLCQALIVTGGAVGKASYVDAGLRTLRWLMTLQTAPAGFFRPVGSDSFGAKRVPPSSFDQQPLEATAAISACLAAWHADGKLLWKNDIERAFAWFLGSNDLSLPLVDLESGGCRDGLHPDRPNENRGAESAVSYLLALAEMRQLARVHAPRTQVLPIAAAIA